MIFLEVFWEFLKVGLFSFGGGHAALPFLYNIADLKPWYTVRQLADMIAVSSVVPGAFGVNTATFAGYSAAGVFGAAVAVVAVLLPSFVIAIVISRFLVQFRQNQYVVSVINVLKPVSCGLLAAVGAQIFVNNISNLFGAALFGFLLLMYFYGRQKNPVVILGICAIIGLLSGVT